MNHSSGLLNVVMSKAHYTIHDPNTRYISRPGDPLGYFELAVTTDEDFNNLMRDGAFIFSRDSKLYAVVNLSPTFLDNVCINSDAGCLNDIDVHNDENTFKTVLKYLNDNTLAHHNAYTVGYMSLICSTEDYGAYVTHLELIEKK